MTLHRRKRNKERTVSRSFKIPESLDNRITDLSVKQLMTRSAWVIKTLEQKAYRHKSNRPEINPSKSGEA